MSETTDDFSRIRAYIDELALAGSGQLPPEPRLAELVNVSRGRLRTVLKKLESEGVIWRHVGKGTFVGPRLVDPKSSDWSNGISLGDIMDARLLFEPPLAAQAAIKARAPDIAALELCLDEMAAAGSYLQWKRLDERLHRLIAEATHNGLLLLLHETLRTHGSAGLDARISEVLGQDQAPSIANGQHQGIVAAIKAGNPDKAEMEMRTHLTYVRAQLFGLR